MKIRKLNARGVAHHFLLALIVVGVAVGGTYYLIASHADTCSVSGTMSSPTSDPASGTCTPDSGPTSAPGTLAATCNITNVPSLPYYGSTITPTITVTNTGTEAMSGTVINEAFGLSDGQGEGLGNSPSLTLPNLSPGASWSGLMQSYKVTYANNTVNQGAYEVSSANPDFDCQAGFNLPTKATYAMSCVINNVPSNVKPGTTLKPTVILSNTGNQPQSKLNITAEEKDYLNSYPGLISGASDRWWDVAKNFSLAAGSSKTIALTDWSILNKLSGSGSASVSFSYSNPNGGKNSTKCVKKFSVNVPTIKSITITPADWWGDKGVSIVKDGSHGKVNLMQNCHKNSCGVGSVESENPWTYKYVTTKYYDFIYANSGKKVRFCEPMRTEKYTMKVPIYMSQAVAGRPNAKLDTLAVSNTKSYKTYCQTFTLANFQDYRDSLLDIGGNMQGTVDSQGNYHESPIYMDNVTLTLL